MTIGQNVYIEHPEVMEVGDNVRFEHGFHMEGKSAEVRLGSNVVFAPNCYIEGGPGKLIVEDNVKFYPGTYFSLGGYETSFIEVGHDCHFAPRCVLYGWGGLKFGPYCNIAAHTVFATVGHNHQITDTPMALSGEKAGPITLEQDVWICANVTVTANTLIARGCVIGANAVVTKDTKPMGVYGGVPAVRLRDR